MKFNWRLLAIVLLAAFLRFYQLGQNPPSLDWDEVSHAYNARALLQTGKDEYGNSWPITIRSFHDYKPALYTYFLIPIEALLGNSEFHIRLPAAIAGTLTVLATYLFIQELFKEKYLPDLSAFLLAISPWHSHISRAGFEANLALLFLVVGFLFLLKSRSQPWFLPISAFSFGFSLLAYHSTKIVAPITFAIAFLPVLKKFILHHKLPLLLAGFVGVMFAGLVGITVFQGTGQARFNTVSFLTIDNLLDASRDRIERENYSLISRLLNHRYLVYAKEIIGGYFDHYNPKFWFIEGDSIARTTYVQSFGLLYWWSIPFLLIGMIKLVRRKDLPGLVIISWFLLAPTASALTSGTPNAIRSFFFLPTFQVIEAIGIIAVFSWHKRFVLAIYALLALVNTTTYFHSYYTHAPTEVSKEWQYGYKQMVEWVMPQKNQWDRIVITNSYDQPYIYVLWYGNYSSKEWINDGDFANRFDKFEFRTIHWDEDKQLKNTLFIGTPDEIKAKDKILWSVNFLDGSPAFLAAANE